ncbi:hypothetical protein PISMIDRAFT_674256 [Pisolithus microcarpus 441]|uniref:Uncharacterized protein n=1 Tax=Pisolithus microcarpus 441 TaxID=765257 RepID=A0A0D0A786_9AGAM|nr:hypothetical protein PISMIDRAFT_674256 [Pisolithus microcarpus 441]
MAVMYIAWLIVKGTLAWPSPADVSGNPLRSAGAAFDIVDILTVDLYEDEYVEVSEDGVEDRVREQRLNGSFGSLWRLFYYIA